MAYTLPEGSDEFAQKALTIGRVYAEDMDDDTEFGQLVQAIASGLRDAYETGRGKPAAICSTPNCNAPLAFDPYCPKCDCG